MERLASVRLLATNLAANLAKLDVLRTSKD